MNRLVAAASIMWASLRISGMPSWIAAIYAVSAVGLAKMIFGKIDEGAKH